MKPRLMFLLLPLVAKERIAMTIRATALVLMLLASFSVATAQMTHEETVVRASYAKLAYAARMGVLVRNVLGAPAGNHVLDQPAELRRQMDAELTFQLRNFVVGNLSDIGEARWDSLVTKPRGDLISVGTGYLPYRTPSSKGETLTEMNYILADWGAVNESSGDLDWNMPVRKVIADLPLDTLKPLVVYSRYASYSVTVTLDQHERTYLALFLFGKNPDGSEAVFTVDHILGMGVLNFIIEHSIYPQPLLETHVREWPGVREWIASAGVSSEASVRDVVCDVVTGKCGIPTRLLEQSLKVRIDPDSRKIVPKPHASKVPQASIPPPGSPTSCSGYDITANSSPSAFGTMDHNAGGQHSVTQNATSTCSYTSGGSQNCNANCQVTSAAGSITADTGGTASHNCHVVGLNWADGNAFATNGAASCTGNLFGGSTECASAVCNCTITVSAGGIVTGSPTVIWSGASPVTMTCNAEPDPTYHGGGGGGDGETGCCGGQEICSGRMVCDPSTCGCTYGSPIIVDTTGHGFHLTSAENGVTFDILGSGRPIKIAWTEAGSGNAFLALDRNHDGKIDNGTELFGNHTAQPPSSGPNGYLALEEFDKPENGGNGDGLIDQRDAVFSHLLLWIDTNHDGVSQPEELHTLPELGVFSISLHYRELPYTDAYGNWFHYCAALNPNPIDGESRDGRWTYDVFFYPDASARTCPKRANFDLLRVERSL
jgi:hypothetical protein